MSRLTLLFLVFFFLTHNSAVGEVANTVHNLSISGPGQIKSQTEDRICIYCHIPHSANPDAPLWNRNSSGSFISYQSSTTDASPGQLNSSSIHCLTCHDGTIALGDLANSRLGTPGDNLNTTTLTGRARIGTDLTNDHPVSIVYDAALSAQDTDLANPQSVDLPLISGELHCSSCHDAHDNSIPPFLHKSTVNGELCITCHTASGQNWDWLNSSHANSTATAQVSDPWSERKTEWKGQTVGENACINCHTPHNALTPVRLLKDEEESTCYLCHNGNVGPNNIQAEFQKFYRHPVDITPNPDHDNAQLENPRTMPLHVECEDCHNPHASYGAQPMISVNPANPMSSNFTTAPLINGSLAGVTGIDISGNVKPESEFEYEVCFKCHGVPTESACENNRCSTANSYQMVRQDGVYNLRDKFDPGNPSLISYHPIYANDPSNNSEVPSLRNDIPLNTSSSQIYCSDCHSSNDSPAGGGSGPAGAHGSSYEGIMSQRYSFNPIVASTTFDDALCFKCHDSGNLLADFSFPHKKHIEDENTGCINCHDPHGSTESEHLINFLTFSNVGGQTRTITGAGAFSQPTWIDNGQYNGTCWLNCHGEVHNGFDY